MDDSVRSDKSSLLNQLRIDRSEPVAANRNWVGWSVGLVAVIGVAAIAWFFVGRASGQPIKTAVAQQVAASSATSGPSLLDASGYVVARRRATVSAKITGKVMEVLIEEGRRVEAGEVIATLDDSNWRAALAQGTAQVEQAQANLVAAQTAFDDAKPIYERNAKQQQAAVISEQTFDQARATYNAAKNNLLVAEKTVAAARAGVAVAQRNLDDTVVRAPFTGVVTEKAAQPGEIVSPMSAGGGFTRTGIGTIVDMDSLEVEVDVSENFINRVTAKQPVSIKLNAYPEWEIPGEVIATIPTADRSKATVKVRIAIKPKDPRIIPEMGARVAFLSDAPSTSPQAATARSAVTVPAEAVQTAGDTSIVYLVHDSAVERRAVRLGAKTDSAQTIVAGLDAGSLVAIGDLTKLSDGVKIRIEKD